MGRRWACALCAAAAILHAVSYLRAGPVDDDFIVYRFARNLVEGRGLVYNLGERVEGFSSPLHLLLCASAIRLGIPPWSASQWTSILASGVAAAAVAAAWFHSRPTARWPIPGVLVAASPAIAYHSAAGLGTTIAAALLAVWGCLLTDEERHPRRSVLAALVLGLACLARAELLLFAVPYALRRKTGRRATLLVFVPLAGWTLFRLAYYGSLLPVTYHVKKLPFLVDLGYGWRYLVRATEMTGIGLVVVLAAAFLLPTRKSSPALRACALGVAVYTLFVVYVGGDYMSFARFFVPILPLGYWLGSEAVSALVANSRIRVALAALVPLGFQWPQAERRDVFRYHEQNEERWIQVGKGLPDSTSPDQSIATSAIGAVGYFSERRIVDMLGMTNDSVWRTAPNLSVEMKGHHRCDAPWVLAQKPDVVLIGAGLMLESGSSIPAFTYERGILDSDEFRSTYHSRVMEIPGSYALIFFQRRDSPVLKGSHPIERR